MKARFENIEPKGESSFAFRDFALPAFPFLWHFHPEIELTLIVAGEGRRFVGDHMGEFGPGDLVLLGGNLPHTWYSLPAGPREPARAPDRSVVIQFDESFLGNGFFDRPELADIGRLLRGAGRGLRFAGPLARVASERMAGLGNLRPFERLAGLLWILDALAREETRAVLSGPAYMHSPHSEDQHRMDRVCRFIHVNYTRSISAGEAARVAHLSESAFGRFFRRASGRNFTTYLTELRVGAACRLLAETDRGVAQVALEAGFNNLSNFNRRFLALKGVRPRDYRRQFARGLEG